VAERLPRLLQGSARGAIGDILTVTVNITDKANIANETQRSRTNKEDSGITDFIGARHRRTRKNPARPHPDRGLDASSDGKGSVNRQEALQTNVAAVGDAGAAERQSRGRRQAGDPRQLRNPRTDRRRHRPPEDIQSDNTIDSSKIAQARIAYGGRGQITDVQQPRYGQQVMDVLLPF
jgi:flagellar L-ring protein precursor FlgH